MLEKRWQDAILVWWWIWWNTNGTEKASAPTLRDRGDISAAHTVSHFLCRSPKTMQEKSKASSSSYLFCVFSTLTVKWPSLSSLHVCHNRLYSPLSHKRLTSLSLPPILLLLPSLLKLLQLHYAVICSLHWDKKAFWVTLFECARLKQTPRTNRTVRTNLTQSLLLWRAEKLQIVDIILCRPLQHSESMSQKYIKIVPMSLATNQSFMTSYQHFFSSKLVCEAL